MAYADVLVTAEVNIIAGFYVGCFGCNTVGGQVPAFICICSYLSDFFQLAYIYSISIINAFSYVSDYFIVSIQAVFGDICLVVIAYTFSIIHKELACIYAVYSQVFLQCQTICSNLKVIFTFFKFNRNCIVLTVNCNAIACCISGVFCIYGVNVLSICSCSFIYRCDISTCFYLCLSSLQLCNVNSVGISSTCCYIGNLTSNFFTLYRTAYRNSTISCLPSNTGFSFSSTIAKRACSCACYAANAQSNAAFYAYACTIANSNCIISCNCIFMTEGNNIAYPFDCVFVAHYNRIGNIVQFIVGTCHEYVMATLFLITGKFVIIADNGRIGLFGNSVGTADYCYSTAFFLSQCAIVTLANLVCFKSTYIHIPISIGNLVAGTLNRYTIRSLDSVCGAHNIISYAGINLTVFIIYSILGADNGCRCTLNIYASTKCFIRRSITVNNRISTYNSSVQATGICIGTYKSSTFSTADSVGAQRGSFIAGMCFIAKSYTA